MSTVPAQAATTTSSLGPGWHAAAPAALLVLAAVLLLYRDTALAMVSIWSRSDTFAHAFLVPPIVAWLVWRRRAELARQIPSPLAWMLLPMAMAGLLWLLGDLGGVNAATQLALVALVVAGVLTIIGIRASRPIWFPLGFLFFAVPIGEFMLPQLMNWTADFTVFALRLSGIPVYRDGLQFVIPSGNWSVVEACSGVRYLIASVMVGVLYAYLNYRSTKRRLVFIAVSFLVPIVANWVRAYLIVMLGHLSNNRLATGVDHLVYGWLFFGLVMVVMFTVGARWVEPQPAAMVVGPNKSVAPAGGAASPLGLWAVVVGAVLVVAFPQWAARAVSVAEDAGAMQISGLQPRHGWQAAAPSGRPFTPAFKNPTATLEQAYGKEGRTVGLYLAYYRHQDYQRKLVSSENVLVPSNDKHWVQTASARRQITLGGRAIAVRTAHLRPTAGPGSADATRVAWRLYWVNATLTDSDVWAKVYGAFYRLLGRGDDGAVIVVHADDDDKGGADAALESFLADNLAAIEAQLQRSRGSE